MSAAITTEEREAIIQAAKEAKGSATLAQLSKRFGHSKSAIHRVLRQPRVAHKTVPPYYCTGCQAMRNRQPCGECEAREALMFGVPPDEDADHVAGVGETERPARETLFGDDLPALSDIIWRLVGRHLLCTGDSEFVHALLSTQIANVIRAVVVEQSRIMHIPKIPQDNY